MASPILCCVVTEKSTDLTIEIPYEFWYNVLDDLMIESDKTTAILYQTNSLFREIVLSKYRLHLPVIKFAREVRRRFIRLLKEVPRGHMFPEEPFDISFKDKTLRFIDLNRIQINKPDFSGANLYRADLSQTYFVEANFRRANLTGTDFNKAILRGSDFTGANLTGTNFSDARLQDTKFVKEDMVKANLNGTTFTPKDFPITETPVDYIQLDTGYAKRLLSDRTLEECRRPDCYRLNLPRDDYFNFAVPVKYQVAVIKYFDYFEAILNDPVNGSIFFFSEYDKIRLEDHLDKIDSILFRRTDRVRIQSPDDVYLVPAQSIDINFAAFYQPDDPYAKKLTILSNGVRIMSYSYDTESG